MIEKVIQIKFEITININVSAICTKKSYTWNPPKSSCENGKYLGSIIDNFVISNKTIEVTESILTKTSPTKSISTDFNEKVFCKIKINYI